MSRVVEKVTAFITRPSKNGDELLLFEHPYAGIQIPAGTVEDGETPEQAVLREATEETGLASLSIRRHLGYTEEKLPQGQQIVVEPTPVYARPDVTSFDWIHVPRGIVVTLQQRSSGFSQVTYEEFDRIPNPAYVSMSITGWVPDEVLAETQRRHFFHLAVQQDTPEQWMVFSDNHHFALFWASLRALPEIIQPQNEWLEFLDLSSSEV